MKLFTRTKPIRSIDIPLLKLQILITKYKSKRTFQVFNLMKRNYHRFQIQKNKRSNEKSKFQLEPSPLDEILSKRTISHQVQKKSKFMAFIRLKNFMTYIFKINHKLKHQGFDSIKNISRERETFEKVTKLVRSLKIRQKS